MFAKFKTRCIKIILNNFAGRTIMNAIELLKDDHDKVERLFQKVKATEDDEHKELFEKIKMELDAHTHIEEKIFYPRLKEEEELGDITLEGIEEHHQAKMFLRELANLSDNSEKFEPKLKVLMKDITHHVQEEEGKMFIDVQKVIDAGELERLGAEMEKERQSFKKS